MTIDVRWFRHQLTERGLSQRALSKKLGLDQSAISLTFSGKRRMQFKEAADIARLFGLPVSEVLAHAGVPVEQGKQTVPMAWIYDGHGETHHIKTDDRAQPPQPMPAGSTAIQCRTAGSPLEHMDGWSLFCEPPTEKIPLDQFCHTQIRKGIGTVGTIRRGYKKGRYNIAGPAGSMADADIQWAQPIVAIRT